VGSGGSSGPRGVRRDDLGSGARQVRRRSHRWSLSTPGVEHVVVRLCFIGGSAHWWSVKPGGSASLARIQSGRLTPQMARLGRAFERADGHGRPRSAGRHRGDHRPIGAEGQRWDAQFDSAAAQRSAATSHAGSIGDHAATEQQSRNPEGRGRQAAFVSSTSATASRKLAATSDTGTCSPASLLLDPARHRGLESREGEVVR
jgi:hypothetical protein